jgi:hypothetical protein
MQHYCDSKGLFKHFVKLTNGISLGYLKNILKWTIIKQSTKEVGVGPNNMFEPI